MPTPPPSPEVVRWRIYCVLSSHPRSMSKIKVGLSAGQRPLIPDVLQSLIDEGAVAPVEVDGFARYAWVGDPPEKPVRAGKFPLGDADSYLAVHRRLRRKRGSASDHPCARCGEPAHSWAYDRKDPDERTDGVPKIGRPAGVTYSTNIEHYLALCWPCHNLLDQQHRNPGVTLTSS